MRLVIDKEKHEAVLVQQGLGSDAAVVCVLVDEPLSVLIEEYPSPERDGGG